jgi:hypothetical protein
MKHVTSLFLACLLGAPVAGAQPASIEKGDAKALLQSGLKLFAAKDYLGALAVFRDAYTRFPSPKILLNIGTTLLKLERKAEAANAYQRYLDTAEGDAAKRDEVTRVIAELDKELGVLEVTVTPDDADVKVGAAEWQRAAQVRKVRVTKGTFTLRARRTAYRPGAKTIDIGANETREVALVLEADEAASTSPTTVTSTETGIGASIEPARRTQFGAFVAARIDPVNVGGAALIGAILDVTDRIQAQAAVLIGPAPGAYAGGSFAILTGRVRPIISAGVPVFISDGPRVGLRGAGGVELTLTRHIALIAELGVEHVFNAEASVTPTLFIPAVGAIGRL